MRPIIIYNKDKYTQTFNNNTTTFTYNTTTFTKIIIIKNIDEYEQTVSGKNYIITKKKITRILEEQSVEKRNTLYINTIKNTDLIKDSIIIEWKINNSSVVKYKYLSILLYLYSIINDKNFILLNTTMNILEEEKNGHGFRYHKDIDLSIQGKDAKRTLTEIMHMILLKNYTIELKIRINNGNIIIIRINNGEIILN